MERNADDPAEQPVYAEPELVTLQEAAGTLGVSQSRLRRWSDEGRIEAVRTAGGHRRFPLDAVRRLAAELGARPGVRPAEPPAEPLLRRAYLQGASLLERHSFLERFSAACQRALTLAGAPRGEVVGTRRLFAALQQSQLAGRP